MNQDPLQKLTNLMIPSVEEEMRLVLSNPQNIYRDFYGMLHYHMGWVDEKFGTRDFQAGKRIRPLLCLLVTHAAGVNWRMAVPGAASIELLHNFTLIHDDIQDSSPTRRGRPTLWQLWGSNLAINAGDAMFALSHVAMSRLVEQGVSAEIAVKSIRRLDETCVSLTIGQHSDMTFEHQDTVSVNEYMEMINGKTAELIAFSAELGARVADCPEHIVKHYAAFGRELGLAFQVRDDILGIWGDESVIGKSAATDIATRKKSLPVLFGLSQSSELQELYQGTDSDDDFVSRVIQLLNSVEAREFAESYEENLASSALNHLTATSGQKEGIEALHQLGDILLNRKS